MGRLTFTTVVADLAFADIVVEAIVEDLDAEERDLEGAQRALSGAHDLRVEHVEPDDRGDGGGERPRRPDGRAALLQSGAGDEARRSGEDGDDERRDL